MGRTSSETMPLVFVGPSCPAAEVKAHLPGALVLPPVARGDLYKFRMLNFSVFVLIDGVFGDALAVSPREVVDVLQDGAAVIGASSMGALRAADCAPAGAIGQGAVYRMFRRGVIRAEDEVAVLHLPEQSHSAMTLALVTVRVALRRVLREGLLSRREEAALLTAAEALPYDRRRWDAILRQAGVALQGATLSALRGHDIKRQDALHCCRYVARRLAKGGFGARPRDDVNAPLGRMLVERERAPDPFCGRDVGKDVPALWGWAWAVGQVPPYVDRHSLSKALAVGDAARLRATFDETDPDLAALFQRFTAFRKAVQAAHALPDDPSPEAEARATCEICAAHRAETWPALMERYADWPKLVIQLETWRAERALCIHLRDTRLFSEEAGQEPNAPRMSDMQDPGEQAPSNSGRGDGFALP